MDRAFRIALEEYFGATEELYAHLTETSEPGVDRALPPRLAFLVRQLGTARATMLEQLKPTNITHRG